MFNRSTRARIGSVSVAALVAAMLAPAHAQDAQTQEQQDQSQEQTTGGQQDAGTQQSTSTQQATGSQSSGQADALVATIGEEDIRTSDVMAIVQAMPEQMRQQPQQMLIPMAVEQAVLRELILQQAMAENLAEDPEVVALVENRAQVAEEDAMVHVWFTREMDERITDAGVQELYSQLQSEAEEELPPLEEVRPQIEQQLGREAMEGIRAELSDNISVVYYGPDGQPVETTAEAEAGTTPESREGSSGSGTSGSSGSSSGSAGSSSTSAGGSSDSGGSSESGASSESGGSDSDSQTGN